MGRRGTHGKSVRNVKGLCLFYMDFARTRSDYRPTTFVGPSVLLCVRPGNRMDRCVCGSRVLGAVDLWIWLRSALGATHANSSRAS